MSKVNYIYPVMNTNYIEGCGFLVDNFFITSGHVIKDSENPFIYIMGKRIRLLHPKFYECDSENVDRFDVAVYELPELETGLELYDGEIKTGQKLESISFKNLGETLVQCDVTVGDIFEGNYFSGLTSKNLKAGCSGSPVLLGNKVIGIMTQGNNDNFNNPIDKALPLNFCMFLSTKSIKRFL